jgi:hypothetical protein
MRSLNRDELSALAAALADRYRVERELGRGGMATVYLERSEGSSRPELDTGGEDPSLRSG